MDRKALANLLEEMSFYLELAGANPFKAKAFQNAARSLLKAGLTDEDLQDKAKLQTVKGIGPSLAEAIVEAVSTGRMTALEEARDSLPPGLVDLTRVPGLGPKRARQLYQELGVKSLGELAYACAENRLVPLSGFGPKTQAKVLAGLEFLKRQQDRFLISDLLAVGRELRAHFEGHPAVAGLALAGEVRRFAETGSLVQLLVASRAPGAVLTLFGQWLKGVQVEQFTPGQAQARHPGGPLAQVRVVPPEEFAAALVHLTGSEAHWTELTELAGDKGLELTPGGLFSAGQALEFSPDEAGEAALYQALGLSPIPPELREGRGEIPAGRAGRLPRLVEPAEVKGLFHVHTTASDGGYSLKEMALEAARLGYQYLGLSDHSRSAAYAGGLKPEDLLAQAEEVRRVNQELKPFRVFHGVESDVLTDGSLDYSPGVLSRLDFVIASIHANFGLDEARQTERVLKALDHPATTILGHPTGRLLLARAGFSLDLEAVLARCALRGVAVEINANPHRLDADWRLARRAGEIGVRLAVGPDAHSLEGLKDVFYGLMVARKAGLTAADLLNCLDADGLSDYLEARKERP